MATSAAATYVLAIMYWSANYGDSSLTVTTQYSTLCSTHLYTQNVIASPWGNQIGSFKTYGTCKVKLWDNTFLSGSSFGLYTSQANLGVMNDAASSYTISS